MTGFSIRSNIFFASSKVLANHHFGTGKSFFSQIFLKIPLSSIVARAASLTDAGRGRPENIMIFFLRVQGISLRTM